jgi:fatty-acyl-CoA synthase
MRPRQWLTLMERNKATISFGPPFGYELTERRIRPGEAEKMDLSNWRVAGIGAEMIRPESLMRFAKALEPAGFKATAFTPCYGMAECSLAISFVPLNGGLTIDYVDADYLAANCFAKSVSPGDASFDENRVRGFVNCGSPLPGFEVEVRNGAGEVLPDRNTGTVYLRGPSVMSGYFGEPEMSRELLSPDGWLNTGDIGYRIGDDIIISGRMKDLIIINGRNIWPQDIEHLCEEQEDVRPGDALAFAAPGSDNVDVPVAVIQCRLTDDDKREELIKRVKAMVRKEIGIELHVRLVPLHTLPRTSSGKLSRAKARLDFIQLHRWDHQDSQFELLPGQ